MASVGFLRLWLFVASIEANNFAEID